MYMSTHKRYPWCCTLSNEYRHAVYPMASRFGDADGEYSCPYAAVSSAQGEGGDGVEDTAGAGAAGVGAAGPCCPPLLPVLWSVLLHMSIHMSTPISLHMSMRMSIHMSIHR